MRNTYCTYLFTGMKIWTFSFPNAQYVAEVPPPPSPPPSMALQSNVDLHLLNGLFPVSSVV